MNYTLAPIALFTYNRPWHTRQVLDALAYNSEAKESILYVFCDGPKDNETIANLSLIKEVKDLITAENRFKHVQIKFQETNKGLANSIISGVGEILNFHDRVIVLEDDIVVGNFFLDFMNQALELYKNEELVYGVTGYCFPSTKKIVEQTYFLPIMSSWGYGTWAEKWKKINFNGDELLDIVIKDKIDNKLDFGHLFYYQMLKDQVENKNNSWAVRFYVSMYLQRGVFLFPNMSLLENIGFDGSGVHCSFLSVNPKNDFYKEKKIKLNKKPVILKNKLIKTVKEGSLKKNVTQSFKFKKSIKRILAPEFIQFIKRKLNKNAKTAEQNLLEFPRYTKMMVTLCGHQITVPDAASYHFMHHEIFKEEIYKFNTLNSKPYIIDGGANIGLASIYFKLQNPNSRIISFEPDPSIFEILKSNIESFNFSDIELVKKGLWSENKELSFISEGADAGLIADVDKTMKPTNCIEAVSLKPYLNQKVDFLKLDIEGAETVVLKDIQDKLFNVERIFIEYHSFVGQPQSLNEVIAILTEANFRLHISSPGLSSKSPFFKIRTYNNMDMQLNIYGYKEPLI